MALLDHPYCQADAQRLYQQLERFAALVAAKEREAILDEWCDRVQSDLEHGEKSANQRAAVYWAKTYPAMFGFTSAIRARGTKEGA